MPLPSRNRFSPLSCQPRRTPSCRGGASSLLRLAQPATPRLPSPFDFRGWADRAGDVLMVTPALGFAPSKFTSA